MYKIKYAKMGNPWEEKEFNTEKQLIAFVETLRPITERPSHVIIEASGGDELSLDTYNHIADKQLYAAQVFYVIGEDFGEYAGLYGGLPSTNKYLARTLGYERGNKYDSPLKPAHKLKDGNYINICPDCKEQFITNNCRDSVFCPMCTKIRRKKNGD